MDPAMEFLQLHRDPVVPIRRRSGGLMWLVTRVEDARRILTDPTVVVTPPGGSGSRYGLSPLVTQSLFALDGPAHTKLRRLVTSAFSARRLNGLRPGMEQLTAELLDRMAAQPRPVDLRPHLSTALPLAAICDLLGIPREDGPTFSQWVDEALMASDEADADRAWRGWRQLCAYLGEKLDEKRRTPAEDLLSDLAAALDSGQDVTKDELIGLAASMMVAGHETTAVVIEYALVGLLRHPDQFAELRNRPELVPQAVEELLRYYPPTAGDAGTLRFTTTELKVGEVLIPAGSMVMISFRALTDADQIDSLARLDIHRQPTPNMIFSHGPHHCVGALLARIELEAVFRALPARFPDLRLAVPLEELQPRLHVVTGGITQIPLTWGPEPTQHDVHV
jgi:cytochrome P450 family 112 subfamily A